MVIQSQKTLTNEAESKLEAIRDLKANQIENYFDIVFEHELSGWWANPDDWPKRRDLKTFKEWFDIEFHSIVEDLVDLPLEDE